MKSVLSTVRWTECDDECPGPFGGFEDRYWGAAVGFSPDFMIWREVDVGAPRGDGRFIDHDALPVGLLTDSANDNPGGVTTAPSYEAPLLDFDLAPAICNGSALANVLQK